MENYAGNYCFINDHPMKNSSLPWHQEGEELSHFRVPGKRRGLAGHLIMQLLYSDYTHIRQLVSDRRQRLVLQNVTFQKEAYKI